MTTPRLRTAAALLTLSTLLGACGGDDGGGFDEAAVRRQVLELADAETIEADPTLVDDVVDSVRDTCEADERQQTLTIALDLESSGGLMLLSMVAGCPDRIPVDYLDDIPNADDFE